LLLTSAFAQVASDGVVLTGVVVVLEAGAGVVVVVLEAGAAVVVVVLEAGAAVVVVLEAGAGAEPPSPRVQLDHHWE